MLPRRGRILPSLLLVCLAVLPLGAWTLFDDFESRNWYNPYWGDGWDRQMPVAYGTFYGRQSMKVTGPTSGTYEPVVTNYFADENWSNVSSIKADIYTDAAALNTTVRIEPHDQAGSSCVGSFTNLTISSTGTWATYSWNYSISASSPVARLYLIFDNLGANAATFYVDNLQLVLQDGTTHYWDDFNDSSHKWGVAGSTAVWSALPEYVSHNASTSTANGGAGLLWWNYSGPEQAELLPAGVNVDWRANNMLRADVRCTTTTAPVKFYLWYGAWGEESEARYVSAADTWQTLYWPMPAGAADNNVQGLNPRVLTSSLIPQGTFYIDNIYAGNIQISVVKSTGTASARPGDIVTCTLTYGNAGTDAASTLLISDVVPFNGSIPEAATAGSADSVEYFAGSSWTSTFDSSATRIRWKDAAVPAGSSGLTVSYKVKVR
ncbi:MAG: hypothetical protein ACYC5N_00590 [Endomicrobiales bacterium]